MTYMVYFNFFCCFMVPLVAMFIIYSHIFLTIRHQMRRIAVTRGTAEDQPAAGSGSTGMKDTGSSASGRTTRGESGNGPLIKTETTAVFSTLGLRISSAGSTSSCGPVSPRPGESSTAKPNIRTSQELRKATSLFLILFLFMVCWMPIHLINCVLLFCPHCDVPLSLTLAAILLSHANSALNPILYAYRMRSFRHTLVGMWKGMQRFRPKPHWSSSRGSHERTLRPRPR